MNSQPINARFLEQRIHRIHNLTDGSEDLIVIFESIERFQKEIQDCRTQHEALTLLQNYIHAIQLFHETAFAVVDANHFFELQLCSNPDHDDAVDQFLTEQIREGRFSWALQQNRPILVDNHPDLPGKQAILHGMSTRTHSIGMFIGFLKTDHTGTRSAMLRILSVLIDATVFVLENQILHNELREYNLSLEATVETRTQELRSANHHLYQSNLELKRLNEVKSEFLGIAAHDLKNPLSAILGFTQIVAFSLQEAANGAPLDYAESIDMLQQVEHSVSHMVQVIHELINSESLDSGKIQLNTEPLDLAKLARKVVAINQSNAISKDIELRFNSEPDLVAQADALRLHEAMDNLISNAVKYSPFHSPVDISLNNLVDSDGKQWIRFSVKDHGPGLTETDKTKLFQRFQKLSARPTAGESSTGLGLSIVKSIIELHQGTVRVESEPGKGSTFSFDLPRAKLTTDL